MGLRSPGKRDEHRPDEVAGERPPLVGEAQQSEDVELHLGGQQLTVARHQRGVLSLAAGVC